LLLTTHIEEKKAHFELIMAVVAAMMAVQTAHQAQVDTLQAAHGKEVASLRQQVRALKQALERRDEIIKSMLMDASEFVSVSSAECQSSAGTALAPQLSESASLVQSTSAAPLSTKAVSETCVVGEASSSFEGADNSASELLLVAGSAEIDSDDEKLIPNVPTILAIMSKNTARANQKLLAHNDWCVWSKSDTSKLQSGRQPVQVLRDGNSVKLRANVQHLFRGVSEVEAGTWRAIMRLRTIRSQVEIWSRHTRPHALHAALDADELERRFIPTPSQRRVNFAQEPGEWQVLGRRPASSRVLIAQLDGAAPAAGRQAASPSTEHMRSPSTTMAPSTALHTGVSAAQWRVATNQAAELLPLVLERQPVIKTMTPLLAPLKLSFAVVADALRFQPWAAPGTVPFAPGMGKGDEGGMLVTRTPRGHDAIPSDDVLIIKNGRLYVGVINGPTLGEWCLHMCGVAASRHLCRDTNFKAIPAFTVARLHNSVQRAVFPQPHGRRVDFAQEVGGVADTAGITLTTCGRFTCSFAQRPRQELQHTPRRSCMARRSPARLASTGLRQLTCSTRKRSQAPSQCS
jgi:hypothetical protein